MTKPETSRGEWYHVVMADGLHDLLRCVLTPGLGPVLLDRLIAEFGTPGAILRASPRQLERCRGIGSGKAQMIANGFRQSGSLADAEFELAEQLGVKLVPLASAMYPEVLRSIPGAPPLLYVLGEVEAGLAGVGVVGSRSCTSYGVEQAERFGMGLVDHGLTVVSGGARGIDAAAHRGALRARGKTIGVLGCGLANRYPPEHGALFDAIVEGGGALVSELPLRTQPQAQFFPGRNRIVSGLSLGVLVIEASAGSGALITARYAADDHGREVMVVPGRVDSQASEGSLGLLKAGSAAVVTRVRDVVELVESPARHLLVGTHARRFAQPGKGMESEGEVRKAGLVLPDEPQQRAVLEALDEPRTLDTLMEISGLDAGSLRAAVTMLELSGHVRRRGDVMERNG